MPSITNYTETLKPFSPIGMRSYATGPMLILLFIVFMGTQIGEEYYRFTSSQLISRVQTWPTEIATIEKVTPTSVRVRDGRYSSHTEYSVRVEYSYDVKGAKQYATQEDFLDYPHRLTGIAFGNQKPTLLYTSDNEKAIEAEYPVGTHHTVRYDPQTPGTALVDIKIQPDGPQDQQRRSLLIGTFLIGALVVALVNSGITKMR